MDSSMQGPYVTIGPSTNEQETAIEMNRLDSNTNSTRPLHSKPEVSAANLLKALLPAALMITIVFWISASHLYGVFRNQGAYTHGVQVAIADFDGGGFGEALRSSAAMNSGSFGYPTYVNVDTSGLTLELLKNDVFKGTYWAAIVVHAGASDRFDSTVNGTATTYDSSNVYSYYVMDARYFTLYANNILTTTVETASAASEIFSIQSITPILADGDFAKTTAALSALAAPALAVELPAAFQLFAGLDDKVFLNTVGTVLPILMQFFFIMAWNGICNGMHLYAGYDLHTHMLYRLIWSIVWPIFTSLSVTGWTFSFRGSYPLDANMFFAFWAVTWVFCTINFDVLDIVTGFVPIAFVPLFFLNWIIWSVAASLGPPEMLNPWYCVNYFFPSLHWFQTLITILTRGGNTTLYYTLPVLAVWLVLMKCLSPLATRKRVRKAQEVYLWYNEKHAIGGPH